MNDNSHKPSTTDAVLAAIKSGSVRMRPRWHFMLRTTLCAVGTVLAAFSVVYLASFIIFVLRSTGVWFAPSFGVRGIGIFLVSLPHVLVVLALVFIILLEWLVRQYAFAYRVPLLYSALGVIALVIGGGFVVAQTSLHDAMYRHARQGDLPPFAGPAGGLYRSFVEAHFGDVHHGTIVSIAEDELTVRNQAGETYAVTITPETGLPSGADFGVGDRVVILGEESVEGGSTTIVATGITKLPLVSSDGSAPATTTMRRYHVHFTPR